MDINEEEHQDVFKKSFDLIRLNKKYTQLGNATLKFFKKRLKDKFNYLERVKKNRRKITYFKELKRVKKHDKMRLRKIKRTEPFPLYKPKKLKKKKIFNSLKKLVIKPNLNYNRILYVHKIYQKLTKKYYYYHKKLKTLKKKSKYIFKLKLHLWHTLSSINYYNKINYLKSTLSDLDQQFKFLYKMQNNYLLKHKIKFKNKIFYTIFKNANNIISRDIYKVKSYNKFIKFYQAHYLDNFFYINLNIKNVIINTYYNKIFINYYNINYYNNFYYLLKLRFLSKIVLQLNNKNYYNFYVYNNIDAIYNNYTKLFKFSLSNISVNKPYKMIFKLNKFTDILAKKARYTVIKLMQAKKWTRHAIAKINTKILKKFVLNNSKLNMYVNDKTKVKTKAIKSNYLLSSTFFKEEKAPIKIKKYNFYFFNFLKKFSILQRRIVKKNHKYNFYISHKYSFFIKFLSYYFKQLFFSLKYIFNSNIKNVYLYLLKLKFLLFSIYYNIFVRLINRSYLKKQKKIINKNKLFTFNILLYYRKSLKTWFSKKRKVWRLKKQKKIENSINKFDNYSKPINIFKYNALLNPRHNLWAKRKIQKYKKIFNVIKYKINGYLRWFKWESRRKLYFKYRLRLLKRKHYKFYQLKLKKKYIFFNSKFRKVKKKFILLKKIKRLIFKNTKLLKKLKIKKKKKNMHLIKSLAKLKKKYIYKFKKAKSSLKVFNFHIWKLKHKLRVKKRKKKIALRKRKLFFKSYLKKDKHVIETKKQLKLQKWWIKKYKNFFMKQHKYKRNKKRKTNNKFYKYKTNIK